MRKRITISAALLLLVTLFCHAQSHTLAEADAIIMVLVFIVIALIIVGIIGMRYNRTISRRNEQLNRILNMLNDYRAIVAQGALTLDEQEELAKRQQSGSKTSKVISVDESQAFLVKMDALLNKEKPFTNPSFNQQSLADFMGVDLETFRQLAPRYEDPDRTLDYINSLRVEYAAKALIDHSEKSMDEMAGMCGFKEYTDFTNAFKFAFGVTPTEYVHSMNMMFKKRAAL